MIPVRDHQSLRQDPKVSIQDAHVDVERKGGYTLAREKVGGEGDQGRVVRSQEFLHRKE
jgi:hypothetical protein